MITNLLTDWGNLKTLNNLLRLGGLIAGIAGIIVTVLWAILVWAPDQNETGPIWFVTDLVLVNVSPFLVGIVIAWKSAKVGSVILIVESLVLPVSILMMTLPNALGEPVQSVVSLVLSTIRVTLPISLPPFVTGILFLLSTKFVGKTKR